jgi:hypothetical protein
VEGVGRKRGELRGGDDCAWWRRRESEAEVCTTCQPRNGDKKCLHELAVGKISLKESVSICDTMFQDWDLGKSGA